MSVRIELDWTWTLEGPLHCGSGLSQPGRADRLVTRFPDGTPVIPGTAVKGSLRQAAEQLLDWVGQGQQYAKGSPADPLHPLLAALFGGRGHHHYRPARLREGQAWTPGLRRSTAIDADSGTASDDTLRAIEVVEAGVAFSAGAEASVPDELEADAVTLLAAALASVESIGAKAGIGWGRVRVSEVSVRVNGESRSMAGALSKERLESLRRPRDPHPAFEFAEPGIRTRTEPASPDEPPCWYRLELRLEEPVVFGSGPLVSNEIGTADHVPATALRGALRAAWISEGLSEDRVAELLSGRTRWTPGFPAQDGATLVPTPRSYLRAKDRKGSPATDRGFHDLLAGDPPSDDINWRSAGQGWISTDGGSAWRGTRITSMHVARDYVTGSHREGALFSRQALFGSKEPLCFVAHARLPRDIHFPKQVHLGHRTTTGLGKATLEVVSAQAGEVAPGARSEPPVDCRRVFVALLSPLLARGERGYWLRTLPWDFWFEAAGLAGEAPGGLDQGGCLARSAPLAVAGWMKDWGHRRSQQVAIDAGSVFRIACTTEALAIRLRRGLRELEAEGLGERRHEGFGCFVVDPAWLGVAVGEPNRTVATPASEGTSLQGLGCWPGLDTGGETAPARLEELLEASRKACAEVRRSGEPAGVERALRWLARRATTAGITPVRLREDLVQMLGRNKPRAWKHIEFREGSAAREGQPATDLGRFLDRCLKEAKTCGPIRFALEALLIRLGEAKE